MKLSSEFSGEERNKYWKIYGHIHYNNGRYLVENFKRKFRLKSLVDTSIFHLLDIDMEMDALSIWNSLNEKARRPVFQLPGWSPDASLDKLDEFIQLKRDILGYLPLPNHQLQWRSSVKYFMIYIYPDLRIVQINVDLLQAKPCQSFQSNHQFALPWDSQPRNRRCLHRLWRARRHELWLMISGSNILRSRRILKCRIIVCFQLLVHQVGIG